MAATGLMDYNARYYDPALGRFISPDPIVPGARNPQAFNRYSYTMGRPLVYTDPSGHIAESEAGDADKIYDDLFNNYRIRIGRDWAKLANGKWAEGNWTLDELKTVYQAILDMAAKLGGSDAFSRMFAKYGRTQIARVKDSSAGLTTGDGNITLGDYVFSQFGDPEFKAKIAVVHELAHSWDLKSNWRGFAFWGLDGGISQQLTALIGSEKGPTNYAQKDRREDWAESVAAFVYPDYLTMLTDPARSSSSVIQGEYLARPNGGPALDPIHKQFVALQVAKLNQ